jgi:hypothetical protein
MPLLGGAFLVEPLNLEPLGRLGRRLRLARPILRGILLVALLVIDHGAASRRY